MEHEDDDDLGGIPGPDPEWDELLAWARESEEEPEWEAVINRAKQAAATKVADETATKVADEAAAQAAHEAGEWGRLLALARAIPSAPRPAQAPRPVPAATPQPPPAGSLASLSARLERLAARVPDARRPAR